jgi:hypothetical protein
MSITSCNYRYPHFKLAWAEPTWFLVTPYNHSGTSMSLNLYIKDVFLHRIFKNLKIYFLFKIIFFIYFYIFLMYWYQK